MSAPAIRTSVAVERSSEHDFRGHAVFAELVGHESAGGLLGLAVGGRRLTSDERSVLDDCAVVMALADPRIWPLKLARVVASYGSFVAGLCAGTVCLEEALIGPWSCGGAAELLAELAAELGDRAHDPDAVEAAVLRRLAAGRRLAGFGVPLRGEDERLVALRARVRALGRADLFHWKLMETVAAVVLREQRVQPNIAMGLAPAALDAGFAAREVAPLMVTLLQATFVANAIEGAQQRDAFLRDVPREHVDYVGAPPRTSPRARR